MARVSFALLLHSHQPVGNFDHVIEETYCKAYRPFLDVLALHPKIRVGLHYTGFLLEWIEKQHPDFFGALRLLVERGQVEMVGGGFYEPILPVIPDRDKRAQILKLREFIRSRFGVTPRGAWLTERVWEPSLARPLAEAGVEYIVLDDAHFIAAGVESAGLRGYYYTEDAGVPLRLVPSLKSLRYAIPFREPGETVETLRRGLASETPARPLFAMGDDLEKFGGWPHTFEHVYKDFWLERFFQAIESVSDWAEMTTLGDYIESNPPLGRIYLPTASYEEMMIWSLPNEAARELQACIAESDRLPGAERFRRFLRGGLWRNFLAKYPESNQVHKLMLDVSRRLETAATGSEPRHATLLAEAENHLLASQCNDAYWHGVFGGLYTPHLRTGIMQHLIRAERALDGINGGGAPSLRWADFDCDGAEEIQLGTPLYGMVLRPADGGTISSLRFKPASIDLINSLARRPEEYHHDVRKASNGNASQGAAESIHSVIRTKEPNLAALLRYDLYARHVFRSYIFPASKQRQDFDLLALGEIPEVASGEWAAEPEESEPSGALRFALSTTARMQIEGVRWNLRAGKWISTGARDQTWKLECRSRFDLTPDGAPGPVPQIVPALAFGLELVFNLLAPDAPGRYFLASGEDSHPEPLKFRGDLSGRTLILMDEWQGVKITINADPEPRWWIAPIETVSQSEGGFERVYQGSSIMAVWRPDDDLASRSQGVLESRLVMEIEPWQA